MKKVIIASTNPVKVAVAKRAFESVYPKQEFEFVAIQSESGVSDQPMNEETEQGAINRLNFIKNKYPDADYWISQEGGIFSEGDCLYNRAWIFVSDKSNNITKSSSARFNLPKKVIEYIHEGLELGIASDKFFNSINSKHGVGAIGLLTDGLINREEYYLQPAIIALSELRHLDWYL